MFEILYLVVAQVEGTVQVPIVFDDFDLAKRKADEIASALTRHTDDVRVFELDVAALKASEVHVPLIPGEEA
jgi:hypothetical protein